MCVVSPPEALQLKLRLSATPAQSTVDSSVQEKKNLRAEFCSSGAAEEGSRVFCIMIEFSDFLWNFKGMWG